MVSRGKIRSKVSLAAGEYGDVSRRRSMAATRNRTVRDRSAALNNLSAKADHLSSIGGAHLDPDQPRMHTLEEPIGTLDHFGHDLRGGQAGDDDITVSSKLRSGIARSGA